MGTSRRHTQGAVGPTLTLRSRGVNEMRGEEVRRERMARGWSQSELARRAQVSLTTISRIESGRDYEAPRLLPKVERALGLGEPPRQLPDQPTTAVDDGPPLRQATAGQLTAELARRLAEHEQYVGQQEGPRVVAHDRIRTGELPPGLSSRPDVGRGPRVDEAGGEAQGET